MAMRRSAIALVFIVVLPATVAGPPSRDALKPAARRLLERADALYRIGDKPGALDAYMEAVDADPNAANLAAIDTYAFPFVASRDKLLAEKNRAALRQYLKLRPSDWEAAKKLADLLDTPEYESVIEPFIRSRPDDADVYATLGKLHERNHRYAAAAADLEKASALDPNNARRHLSVAFAEYEVVAKDTILDQAEKRKRVQHGLAEADRGEALEPGFAAAMTWRSLLLREQAKLESDPEVKGKLLAEADAANELAHDRFYRMVKPPLQKAGDNSLSEGTPRESPADWQHVTSISRTFE
jgi:tetratricopeptide (TPR) repeat protein